MSPDWVGELFARIAVPRLPGSAALVEVERAIMERLSQLGYQVRRRTFSTSPVRLTAASVAGAGVGWLTLALVPLLRVPVPGWIVTLLGTAGLGLIGLVALGIAERRLPDPSPPIDATNLEARRGEPRLWLVAHADSKAQRFSLLTRVVAATGTGLGVLGLGVALLVRLAGPVPWWLVVPAAGLALCGGAILSAGAARNASPGAVDNATGILTVLVAAARLRDRADVGVLITGAEEFGVEGARRWVDGARRDELFVNVDGVDGRGRYRVMVHGRDARSRVVAQALLAALRSRGCEAVRRPLPPGILVDGVVLARAGLAGVTLSRGALGTLAVVHTPRDRVARVDLAAAVEAGEATAAAARALLG